MASYGPVVLRKLQKRRNEREAFHFVNLVIFVPHVGQIARSMFLPFEVFALVAALSGTVFFSLHFTQYISTMKFFRLLP